MSELRDDVANALRGMNDPGVEREAQNNSGVPELEENTAPEFETRPDEVSGLPKEQEEKQSRQRDESGKFSKKQEGQDSAKPKAEAEVKIAGAPEVKPIEVADKAVQQAKPPQSWKPIAREKWASLPAEVQSEVARRERETAMALQESAESKKFYQAFRETISPYEGMIRAEGSEPLRAVSQLLQTAAALRTAPPEHKARLVAGLVKQFSIPIEALDNALVGQPIQASQQQNFDPNQFAQTIKQQIFGDLANQRQQYAKEKYSKEIESFGSSNEFFEDVREDMADIIEMAAKRGVVMSIDEAYSKAVKLHPEISAVVQQRESAKAAGNAQASTIKAKMASSSVKGQPAGVSSEAEPKDLREFVAAAARKLSNR